MLHGRFRIENQQGIVSHWSTWQIPLCSRVVSLLNSDGFISVKFRLTNGSDV